jgi:cytochrome P450
MTLTATDARAALYPIGSSVDVADLARDPYPTYARMRTAEPISWVAALGMYYVVRYEHVQAILGDPVRFSVGTEHSTLFDTFGTHMLTVDDSRHEQYRAAFQPFFVPSAVRHAERQIRGHVDCLIDAFAAHKRVDLRHGFASRLPVRTMLSLLGLPLERESDVRRWYDSFEAALANFRWDADVRSTARLNVEAFRLMIQEALDQYRRHPEPDALLSNLANAPTDARLDDEAIQRNALIVLFGGISTVEALILNAVHALSAHPDTLDRVRADFALIPAVLDETMRWSGPVQSATRHVAADTTFAGVELRAGEIVNCMIAAANRDPAKFPDPHRFDISRPGLRQHLGFASGMHHCVGLHLAKLEARITLERLLARLPDCRAESPGNCAPQGCEFRRPPQLTLVWS